MGSGEPHGLDKRLEFLRLTADGKAQQEIADALDLSRGTSDRWRSEARRDVEKFLGVHGLGGEHHGAPVSDQFRALMEARAELERENIRLKNQRAIIIEQVRACVPAIPAAKQRMTPQRKASAHKPEEVVNLALSDWHVGERVQKHEVAGLNEFNHEICFQRLRYLLDRVQKLVDYHRKYARIEKLHVFCLGDFNSGEGIYGQQAYRNDLPMMRQFHTSTRFGAWLVRDLAAEFSEVTVEMIPGNHGVPDGRKSTFSPSFNVDRLTYDEMEHHLSACDNVTCRASDSLVDYVTNAAGKTVLFSHGDAFGAGSFNIPRYGYGRWIGRQMRNFKVLFDRAVIGHWHTPDCSRMESCWAFMTGCLPGSNEYSHKKGLCGLPGQMMWADSPGVESPAWVRNIDLPQCMSVTEDGTAHVWEVA